MGRGRGRAQRGAARPVALIGAGLAAGMILLAVVLGQRGDDGATPTQAQVAAAADCLAPEVLDGFGLRLDQGLASAAPHAGAPAVGRVPSSFRTAGVLVCQSGGTLRDGSGTWTVVTATTREGTAAQLDTLLAALEGAPAPGTPSARPSTCSADGSDRVQLWLVDSMGRAVRPRMPSDTCGRPSAAVRRALDALAVTDQSDSPVSLVAPASPSPSAAAD